MTPSEAMDLIRGRRTVHEFRPDPIPREQVEQMLEAATWAPNHKLTQPWEFYVVCGETKERLARLRGELKRRGVADPSSEQAQKVYEKAYSGLATPPWAILVCQVLSPDDPVREQEDLLAVACAVQNLMLAANAMGIGTFWGSGPLVNHPETFKLLGVPEGRRALGLIFVGYPAREEKVPARQPAAAKTRWFH
ncbi:MAG: nitroreductase family protein [Bacillota bacterium]